MGRSNKSTTRQERCIYCYCLLDKKTRDHVPPKCIFPKGTQGLITVPACPSCNGGFAKDDEYFRQMMSMAIESSTHPQAKEPLNKALKNLDREESKGLRLSLADALRPRLVEYTPGSLEPGFECFIELQRIGNVVTRTVMGLLWKETQLRLSDHYGIAAVPSYNFDFLEPLLMALIAEVEARELNSVGERRSIGNGAFEYWWHRRHSEQELDSAWVLRFFGGIYFVCLIVPDAEIGKGYFRRD